MWRRIDKYVRKEGGDKKFRDGIVTNKHATSHCLITLSATEMVKVKVNTNERILGLLRNYSSTSRTAR